MNSKIKEFSKSLSGAAELMLNIGAFVTIFAFIALVIKSLLTSLAVFWGQSWFATIVASSILLFLFGGILKFSLGVLETAKINN